MKKTIFLLLIFFFFLNSIVASNLSLISLDDASDKELELMCAIRNLDCPSSREGKISILKEALESESTVEKATVREYEKNQIDQVTFKITNANSMKKISDISELIILSGNVILEFSQEGETKQLTAENIVIDLDNSKLVALGNVVFSMGEENNTIISQDISGQIVTLNWDTNIVLVTDGSVFTERENSENETVILNATSSLITLNSINNSLILKDGFITTNPDTAYSSISASKIAILNHGDMYLENAKVSIGRVPILYLPYFYSPGATMIGNPSIGYNSTRGLFVNTTFEILGKYPDFKTTDSNSFTSLLQTEDNQDTFASSLIYDSEESESKLQQWAMETDSYFTLLLDAYESTPNSIDDEDNGSVVLGYASQFNLINNSLQIKSTALTSFASDGISGDLTSYTDYPIFRYDTKLEASLEFESGDLNISMPVISDPYVRESYGNRLSTFSIDALWSDLSFPTTYSSDITSYSWTVDGSFDLSPENLSPYIDSFKITSIKANIDYEWEKEDGSYSYIIDEMTLPYLTSTISGTLVKLTNKSDEEEKEENNEIKEDNEIKENNEIKEEENISNEDLTLLNLLYKSNVKKESVSDESSYYELTYNLKNTFYYTDSDEKDIYNKSYLTLSNDLQIDPDKFAFENTNSFNYIYNDNFDDYNLKSFDVLTKNIIQLPFLNLSYYFNTRLYKYSYTDDSESVEEEVYNFEFSDDYITKHEIEWSKAYKIKDLTITPSLNFQLPPLDLEFQPSLQLDYRDIENETVFTFDVDSSTFELTQIDDYLNYSFNNFSFDFDLTYDVEDSKTSSRFLDSLILESDVVYNNKNKNQYFSYTSKYYGLYDDSIENYFSTLLFTYKNDFLVSKLNFYTSDSQVELDYFKNTFSLNDYTKYWWKNRIGLKLSLDTTFNYSFSDKYSTYLSLTGDLSFKIAEFLSLDLSITTSNYGFYTYYNDDDTFNFSEMFSDLLSSFDIFGDGIYSTQFNLEEISLDLVHMMDDWDLHCKYNGSVVLSNYTYQWVPTLSIFLQWNSLPELKIDQSFTDDGDGWDYSS